MTCFFLFSYAHKNRCGNTYFGHAEVNTTIVVDKILKFVGSRAEVAIRFTLEMGGV